MKSLRWSFSWNERDTKGHQERDDGRVTQLFGALAKAMRRRGPESGRGNLKVIGCTKVHCILLDYSTVRRNCALLLLVRVEELRRRALDRMAAREEIESCNVQDVLLDIITADIKRRIDDLM